MEKNKKVWIRGNDDYPERVIAKLVELGGENTIDNKGSFPYCIYFIDYKNIIRARKDDSAFGKVIMEEYQEIKLEEDEEYKFEPFDKVLVRYADDDYWDIDFFSHYETTIRKYSCLYSNYDICIPYNDKTKHLLNTNKPYVG